MKLKDFYFADKHEAGSRMPIMLPNGEDSGEWLQVRGPDCDVSIEAGRAYTAAVRAVDASLEELEAACKAKDNYTEWNEKRNIQVESLNRDLAVELVTGWSFDEEFSREGFAELLRQYRGLAPQVATFHTRIREELNAK